jgi:hypothetical protein
MNLLHQISNIYIYIYHLLMCVIPLACVPHHTLTPLLQVALEFPEFRIDKRGQYK